MAMNSKLPPREPGLYIFRGVRRTQSLGYMVSVNDICEVREIDMGSKTTMACFFLGRSKPYLIDLMEGEWELAAINLEGKRCN